MLLDVFLPDPKWGEKSKIGLERAFNQGSLIINEIIYSELAPQFPDKTSLDNALKILSIRIISVWKREKSQRREISEARSIISYLAINDIGYSASEVGRFLPVGRVSVGRCAKQGQNCLTNMKI